MSTPSRFIMAIVLVLANSIVIYGSIKYHDRVLGYMLYFVPTESMHPTLEPGDVILVNTKELDSRSWDVGSVVVFQTDERSDRYYTKRIARKPQHLSRTSDQLFFVLGDNAEHSADSRAFGMIHRDRIRGKVEMVLWNTAQPTRALIDIN